MKVLAIRFSAMGDVALLAAAAKAWLRHHPDAELVVCSRPVFQPLFEPIERCTFFGADVKKHYKGLFGMKMLADHLVNEFDIDHVADMHDVLRSRMLCTFLRFQGFTISRIKKDRIQKKRLTSQQSKQLKPLKHTVQRYLDALPGQVFWSDEVLPIFQHVKHPISSSPPAVGIAPYAKHPTKQWPEESMRALVHRLTDQGIRCVLFGTIAERHHFKSHFTDNDLVIPVPDDSTLRNEMEFIRQLNAFVAMDSFNMHLAALCGVPVVSIWGPTHPYTGFAPLGPSARHLIQIDLECRPCSIYGNKPCYRGDHACMLGVSVERVYQEVLVCVQQNK